jgi:hypothetical protein
MSRAGSAVLPKQNDTQRSYAKRPKREPPHCPNSGKAMASTLSTAAFPTLHRRIRAESSACVSHADGAKFLDGRDIAITPNVSELGDPKIGFPALQNQAFKGGHRCIPLLGLGSRDYAN